MATFDPPHLLQFTCNLFLKHDVANVECDITVNGKQLTDSAKWEGILKVYDVDRDI